MVEKSMFASCFFSPAHGWERVCLLVVFLASSWSGKSMFAGCFSCQLMVGKCMLVGCFSPQLMVGKCMLAGCSFLPAHG